MNRRHLLKSVDAVGIGSMLPLGGRLGLPRLKAAPRPAGVDCVLIPQETEGPYPLDLSGNAAMFRQDITEGRSGLPLNVLFTLVNINDGCAPIANARVDVWHCDKDGVYSGYAQPGANTVGQTFMRGIQMSDSAGQVHFTTVYPGWYAGRITHIHFQVFISSVLRATSQAAFPDDLNQAVYATSLYAARGQNTSVANNAADSVFATPAGDLQHELFAIVANAATGGYDAALTVGIDAPVAGLVELHPETGGQFTLAQNAPNPFRRETAIAFTLAQASAVELTVFDMTGRRVTQLVDGRLEAGEHTAVWDGMAAGTPVAAGNYVFELTVTNGAGQFRSAKVMTRR